MLLQQEFPNYQLNIKPVSLGISGPGMSERQAFARIRPVSERAVEAILKVAEELKRIK